MQADDVSAVEFRADPEGDGDDDELDLAEVDSPTVETLPLPPVATLMLVLIADALWLLPVKVKPGIESIEGAGVVAVPEVVENVKLAPSSVIPVAAEVTGASPIPKGADCAQNDCSVVELPCDNSIT